MSEEKPKLTAEEEQKKVRKKKVTLLIAAVLVIIVVAYQSITSKNLMNDVNFRDSQIQGLQLQLEAGGYKEVDLGYTIEDLHTLKAEPMTMEIRKLEPSEWSTDITVEKWEGEDYIIGVPNSNPTAEEGLGNRINRITLLDGTGVIAQYDTGTHDVTDINLMEEHMLVKTRDKSLGIAGIAEIGYDGTYLWGITIDKLSHSVEPLDNGNFLIVRGDYDQVCEIDRGGSIVWEWNCMENILPFNEDTYDAYEYPSDKPTNLFHYNEYCLITGSGKIIWTHVNGIQKLDDGYFISLRNQNLALKVGFDKEIQWTFGALLWKYQHYPRILENGNILVYDNGGGKVAEYTRNGEIVWSYPTESSVWGRQYKLDNGNYLVPQCFQGQILEVTTDNEIVKQIQMGKMPVINYGSIDLLDKIKRIQINPE